jgi:general secretion pathway protein I
MNNTSKKNKGFTLLEVMVALFIVAVAMGGAIKVVGNAAQNTSRMVDKTFANWVALNQIAELRIKSDWPKLGELKGEQEMSDRKWKWLQTTIKTDDENIKRVEVSVWADADADVDPYVTVIGFLAKP